MRQTHHLPKSILTLFLIGFAFHANAAPRITNMPIRGLQAGATTTITIQGSELLPNPKLVASFPVANQVVLEKAAANNVRIEVTLGDDVTPGMYNLRLANENGISNNMIIAVDRLPQVTLGEKIETTPIAVHGQVTGSTIVGTKFSGKSGEQILIDVESQRLGGKLRPVIHLYDSRRRQVAWAMSVPWLSGDARLTATLPADGEYKIEIHDLQYAGPAPGNFRLKVGSFQYADMVFPPAVERGKKTKLTLLGNVPADKLVEVTAEDNRLIASPWPELANVTGLRPQILISDFPEILEISSGDKLQQLPGIPVAVSGRLDARGQEDIYRLAVEEGTKLRFEVFADRIGSPIDPILEIKNEKGGRLGLNDDTTGTTDSRLDYTVAKGVKTIDLFIKDQVDRGDDRSIYRIVITNLGDAPKQTGFHLTVAEETHNVRQGASKVFQVAAKRKGYDGPIRLSFDQLPPGVTATELEITAGSNGALITLTASGEQVANMITTLRGTSVDIDPPITATAAFEKHPLGKLQPWMQSDIALARAPSSNKALTIDWSEPLAETPLVLGTTFRSPLQIKRPPGVIGPVRLSLVAGEPPRLVNGKPDANQVVRPERATFDIPVDAKAKAAFDALAAAEKALTAAIAKTTAMRESGQKAIAKAKVDFESATQKKNAAATAVATATLEEKTANDANVAASKARNEAQSEVETATDDKKAAANAKLMEANVKLAVTEKKLSEANTKLSQAKKEFNVAKIAHAVAETREKEVIDSVTKNDAIAETAVKNAQAKRDEAEKTLQTAEKNIKPDAAFNVIVPPNVPIAPYDLAIKAELRSLDNRTVVATYFTPVRRFKPLHPLGLKLTGDPKFEAKLDAKAGAIVKLTGIIERKAKFGGDVTVSITGQPGGVAVPKTVIKPDNNDFELELKFPANFKPAEVKSIKLFATGPPNPKAANIVVRTEIPITVNILAPEPKPEK